MKLSKDFYLKEFESHDGAKTPDFAIKNLKELAQNLEVLRAELGVPILINSGYRSPEHNKRIGGVRNSQHTLGKAADIKAQGYTPKQIAEKIERLIKEGKMKQGGLGIYHSFVHYDIRGYRARWKGNY